MIASGIPPRNNGNSFRRQKTITDQQYAEKEM